MVSGAGTLPHEDRGAVPGDHPSLAKETASGVKLIMTILGTAGGKKGFRPPTKNVLAKCEHELFHFCTVFANWGCYDDESAYQRPSS